MDWTDDPATEQQLMHLKNLGLVADRPLSRMQAARLIRECRRHPARMASSSVFQALAPVLNEREMHQTPAAREETAADHRFSGSAERISESARMLVYRLRHAVEEAKRALAVTPQGPNIRANVVSSTTSRQDFWLDTCRDAREMRTASLQVLEFYQAHGCRFFEPTHDQVQHILNALDTALTFWDRDNPELFYQTLEINFPQLVRRA
jgi:hypothetical protein